MAILRNITDENYKVPTLIHAFILDCTVSFYKNDKIGFVDGKCLAGYRDPGNTHPDHFSGATRKGLKHYGIPEEKIIYLAESYSPQRILNHYIEICKQVNSSNNHNNNGCSSGSSN